MDYGFVYIWHDMKRDMFYIGCHWGNEKDGYVCSSKRMRDNYRLRPTDFRRKVLKRIYSCRKGLIDEEFKWLQLIPKKQLGQRYYNIGIWYQNHWSTTNLAPAQKSGQTRRGSKPNNSPEMLLKRGENISKAKKGKALTVEHKQALRESKIGRKLSTEHREALRQGQLKRYQQTK